MNLTTLRETSKAAADACRAAATLLRVDPANEEAKRAPLPALTAYAKYHDAYGLEAFAEVPDEREVFDLGWWCVVVNVHHGVFTAANLTRTADLLDQALARIERLLQNTALDSGFSRRLPDAGG